MSSLRRRVLALGAVALLAGCEDTDGGLVGPERDAAVVGRIERETPTAGSGPLLAPALLGDGGARAATVEVARVQADGSLRVVAQGTLAADGSYRVEGVSTGRTDLMVVARSGAGTEVGRVLLAGSGGSTGEILAAPMNGETTLQGRVYSELRALGMGADQVSPAELSLLLRVEHGAAATLAGSGAALRALARAYAEASATMTLGFARLGEDLAAGARQRVLLSAQADHQALLHQGMGTESAHEVYLEAAVDALVEGGADPEAVVLATAVARAALETSLRASGAPASSAISTSRASARFNLIARLRLLGEAGDSGGGEERTAQAILGALASLRFAGSASAVEEAMEEVEAEARQGLLFELRLLFAGAGVDFAGELESRLLAALEAADLSAELSGESDVAGRAEAVVRYRQRVHAAARSFVDAAPAAGVDAAANARVLIAARGG